MSQGPGLRERKNARTRAAIERAALELAAEHGWEHTTVDQIAERADVSPRTVYTRYATKDAIVFSDMDDERPLEQALAAGDGDLVDRIVAFVQERVDEPQEEPELGLLWIRVVFHDPALRQMFRARLDEGEQAIIRQLSEELGVSEDDAGVRVFAAAVVALFMTMIERIVGSDADAEDPLASVASGIAVLRAALPALHAR